MDPLAAAWDAFGRGESAEAEHLYHECLATPGLTPEQQAQARCGLAYVFAFTGRFDEARAGFEGLRQEAARRQDRRAEHQVGMVERMAGCWEEARACFEAEQQMIEALGSEPLAVSINAYELGTVAQHFGEADSARGCFGLALSEARKTGDLIAVACALRGLGDLERALGSATQAGALWQAARDAFRRAGDDVAGREMEQRLTSLSPGPR